jgi:hypothetical protein
LKEKKVIKRLVRFIMKRLCPDEERIADYINGRLNDNDISGIEEHLAGCETCRQELIIGKGLVRGGDSLGLDPVPDRVTQSSLRLVNRQASIPTIPLKEKFVRFFNEARSTIADLFRPVLWENWGLAAIRGSRKVICEDIVHISRRFKDIETEIEVEKVGEARAHIRIKLIGDIHDNGGVRVTLKRGEREVSSCLPDSRGHVLFEDIPFDHYSLHFIRDNITLGIYPFEIKEK